MIKKMLSVLLALMLCMVATAAIAESPDSPGSNYAEVEQVVSNGTVTPSSDFFKPAPTMSEETKETVDALKSYIDMGGSALNFFGVNPAAVATMLPDGVDPDSMEVNTMTDLSIGDYDPAYGDVSVTMKLDTPVDPAKATVVLVGYVDANGVKQWMPVEAVANADGSVTIDFSAGQLMVLGGKDLTVAVLQG